MPTTAEEERRRHAANIAKAVRDFVHYFGRDSSYLSLQPPTDPRTDKLVDWIEDQLEREEGR